MYDGLDWFSGGRKSSIFEDRGSYDPVDFDGRADCIFSSVPSRYECEARKSKCSIQHLDLFQITQPDAVPPRTRFLLQEGTDLTGYFNTFALVLIERHKKGHTFPKNGDVERIVGIGFEHIEVTDYAFRAYQFAGTYDGAGNADVLFFKVLYGIRVADDNRVFKGLAGNLRHGASGRQQGNENDQCAHSRYWLLVIRVDNQAFTKNLIENRRKVRTDWGCREMERGTLR